MTRLNSETLASWQLAFLDHYAQGGFAHLAEGPGNEFEARLNGCGDSFVRSCLIELDPAEGCDTDDEAINRLDQIAEELHDAARMIQRNEVAL